MTYCNPIYNMLLDVDGDYKFIDINKFAAYRNEARTILDSKASIKAKILTEIAYQNQQVGILLPQPMEELDSNYFNYLDWVLKDEGDNEVGTLVNVSAWYPVVKKSISDNTNIELEFDRDKESVTITVNSLVLNVKATTVNSKDGFDYFAVAWPKQLGIKAIVKLKETSSYCYLELPSPDYDIDSVVTALTNSETIISLLEDTNLIESFYLSDTNREKIAITILAMYKTITV